MNGLWITPKHPVKVANRWFNPAHLYEVVEACPNTTWYNFELRGGNSFFVNGIELVALGHDNVIAVDQPAYSAEKDAKYGRGWMTNPQRAAYLKNAVPPKAYRPVPAAQSSLPVF